MILKVWCIGSVDRIRARTVNIFGRFDDRVDLLFFSGSKLFKSDLLHGYIYTGNNWLGLHLLLSGLLLCKPCGVRSAIVWGNLSFRFL